MSRLWSGGFEQFPSDAWNLDNIPVNENAQRPWNGMVQDLDFDRGWTWFSTDVKSDDWLRFEVVVHKRRFRKPKIKIRVGQKPQEELGDGTARLGMMGTWES